MGMLLPVFVTFVMKVTGYYIFREPKDVGMGPLFSCYVFTFTLFLLFYDLRLYPQSLRSLGKAQMIIEFLVANFLMENIVLDFWFPLETEVMNSLDKISDQIEEMLSTGNWSCDSICDFIKNDITKISASYMMSSFMLIAVLHGIRAIDLRALKESPSCFFEDITYRAKKAFKKKLKIFGIGKRRGQSQTNSRRRPPRPDEYCGEVDPDVVPDIDFCD